MQKGLTLWLMGEGTDAVVRVLAERLLEMGRPVERVDNDIAKRLGDAAFVCRLLSRNGIIVLATYGGAKPQEDCLEMAVDPRDTPDFAAEKILHGLEEKGVIERASADYTPQEEEEIRRRLADLGYIE